MQWIRRISLGLLALIILLLVIPFVIPLDTGGLDPRTLADPDGRFINVDGLDTYVLTYGNPSDPPVLFLHGLFGSTFVWRNNAEVIADGGYYVITFDRPGAGLTAKPQDYNYGQPNQADFVALLLDALDIEQATIVGHSAGGNVLAQFALRHPDRVERLVIVDGAIVGASGPPPFVSGLIAFPPIERWGLLGAGWFLTDETIRSTLDGFHADPSFLTEADYAGYLRAFDTENWQVGLLGLSRDSGNNRIDPQRLTDIQAKTLLIWGEADTITSLEQGRELDALLPNSRLVVYPGIGHQPMEENSAAFNADVLAFLEE